MDIHELQGMGIIGGSITVVMILMEVTWRWFGAPRGLPHEVWRKGHHIGIGLVASHAHRWISNGLTGAVLAVGFGAFLLLMYRLQILTSFYRLVPDEDGVVLRKYRHSWVGPTCYSLAVAITCFLYWGDPAIFRSSLLILTLGDAAATLAGMWLGTHHYHVFGARRSLEGNLALFSFASLLCGFTISDGTPTAIMIALLLGLLISLTETVSPFGLDNLSVPLMTAVLLTGLKDSRLGGYALDSEALAALALLAGSALVLTMAHVHPRVLRFASLFLGIAVFVLLDIERTLFVAIACLFLACTLLAHHLATREGETIESISPRILTNAAPCLVFVAAALLLRERWLVLGAVSGLILLSRSFWREVFPPSEPRVARTGGMAGWEIVSLVGVTWGVVVSGALLWTVSGLEGAAVSFCTAVAATLLGGLSTHVLAPAFPDEASSTGQLWIRLLPGVLAIAALPILSKLVLGMMTH